jgi:hypothetical protein
MDNAEQKPWDVFIAHAGADVASATQLSTALSTAHGLSCFLDAERLRAGEAWPLRLKKVLAQSRLIAVLTSQHSDAAYYLQEEVAIAIAISRRPGSALRVVPVVLRGADQMHLPYGTFSLHALYESQGGWPTVAISIAKVLDNIRPPQRSASIGRSAELTDEIWADLESVLTDRAERAPDDFHLRYRSEGEDFVVRERTGNEVQRVTRDQLDTRLPQELLHHIEVLERSMDINKAIWDERYPLRVRDKRSKKAAENALRAMADDLQNVLDIIVKAGMWLDDHYMGIRMALSTLSSS